MRPFVHRVRTFRASTYDFHNLRTNQLKIRNGQLNIDLSVADAIKRD